ncbi:MAG: hypothetical protein JXM70_29820 [Pirellulales bacterium]|nr:hypothetical protein [Pirellulales bacterium]
MDIETLTSFFMWCTIINVAFLAFSFLFCAFGGDFIYRMHGKWFPMSRETLTVVLYSYMGIYKIVIIVFNLVPYLALSIVG